MPPFSHAPVSVHASARIIHPANPAAIGRRVRVLRRATGSLDLDGVEFSPRPAHDRRQVWVVKGDAIPWGDGKVNVIAIGEECLQVIGAASDAGSSDDALKKPDKTTTQAI